MGYITILLAALITAPLLADAQQVPNPAPIDAVTGLVGTNQLLKKYSGYKNSPVFRAGFWAAYDGGAALYKYGATACTLNSGNGDEGYEIKPSTAGGGTGCWTLVPHNGLVDLRVWGAKPLTVDGSFDNGTSIRAASYYSGLTGNTIGVPVGTFIIRTLDPEGTAAIVFGKITSPSPSASYPYPTYWKMPNFVGQSWHNQPDLCTAQDPQFYLGPGLKRPLISIKVNSVSPRLENLCLSGGAYENTPGTPSSNTQYPGYPGGPGGKLYVIQLDDFVENPSNPGVYTAPASSFRATNIAVRDGYNGNIYMGSGRSLIFMNDSWSLYSGQTTADTQIQLNGYDSIFYNLQQGFSKGNGVYVNGGVNFTFTAGGMFWNGGPALYVTNVTSDLQLSGIRFNDNQCEGIRVDNNTGGPGYNRIGGRFYSGLIFNDNSKVGNGVCDDIVFLGNALFRDTFIGTVFEGPLKPTATVFPRYHVATGSLTRVVLLGSMFAPNASTGGYTNDALAIVGDHQYMVSWAPTIRGVASGTSTPQVGSPIGNWYRSGKLVTASGNIKVTAFTASGDMIVGPFPHLSAVGSIASCTVGRIIGFVPSAGYTTLSMMIGENTQYASMWKSGPSVVTDEVAPTDLVASVGTPLEINFTCSYQVKDGS